MLFVPHFTPLTLRFQEPIGLICRTVGHGVVKRPSIICHQMHLYRTLEMHRIQIRLGKVMSSIDFGPPFHSQMKRDYNREALVCVNSQLKSGSAWQCATGDLFTARVYARAVLWES